MREHEMVNRFEDEALNLELEANRLAYWGDLKRAAPLMYRAGRLHEIPLASAQCYQTAGEMFSELGEHVKAFRAFAKAYKVYKGISDVLALNCLRRASRRLTGPEGLVFCRLALKRLLKIGYYLDALEVLERLISQSEGSLRRRYLRKAFWALLREIARAEVYGSSLSYRLSLRKRLLRVTEDLLPISRRRFRRGYERLLKVAISRAERAVMEFTAKHTNPLLRVDRSRLQRDLWEEIREILDEREKVVDALTPLAVVGEVDLLKDLLERASSVHLSIPVELYRSASPYLNEDERVALLKTCELVILKELVSLFSKADQELVDLYQAILMERLGDLWREHDPDRAKELYRVAIKIYSYRGDAYAKLKVMIKVGDLLMDRRPELALLYYYRAKSELKALGYALEHRELKRKLARAYRRLEGKLLT